MGIERFLPPDEFIYRLDVGTVSVRHRISSIKQLWLIAYIHNTESEILEELSETLTEEDLFLDIGANVGVYGAVAGATGASVAAVEPLQQNSTVAKQSLELNCPDPLILPFAIGDENGVIGMGTHADEGIDDRASLDGESVTTGILTGDTLVEDYLDRVPTVIKIDVEGSEREVLAGLDETLADEQCSRIYVEIHTESLEDGTSTDDIRNQLAEYGFSTSIIEERDQSGDTEPDQVFVVGEK